MAALPRYKSAFFSPNAAGDDRRTFSPTAQRHQEELWKARIGLVVLTLTFLATSTLALGLLRHA